MQGRSLADYYAHSPRPDNRVKCGIKQSMMKTGYTDEDSSKARAEIPLPGQSKAYRLKGEFGERPMFHRIVVIFVIGGFIAGQWLAVPHAHGEATRASGHHCSSSPHLHLSWFSVGCPDREDAHHGHEHGDCHRGPRESRQPAITVEHGTDHDADALYIAVADSTLGPTARDGHSSLTVTKALLALAPIPVGSSSTFGFCSCRQETPEFRAPKYALYLQLRTLRI
jgi:hypothetical protein